MYNCAAVHAADEIAGNYYAEEEKYETTNQLIECRVNDSITTQRNTKRKEYMMKNRKRILAALLAVVMTISMLPVSAFAAETAGDTAAENDAEPVIVSNEEYEAEPTVEDVSSQDAHEETVVPAEETAENEAAEPEAQSETVLETQSESKPEAQPEVIPASEPEEEQPVQPETEPASAEESAEVKEEAADAEPVTLTYEGRDYTVTAAFDPTAFPAGVQMKAREIRKSNSSYQDLYDQALETVQKETEEEVEITHARFFDITFYTEEEDNIEPDGTVNVNIKYTKALTVESTDDISVLHFDEKKEEPQLMEIETSGSRDDKVDEISFETESFSVYAVIGTNAVIDDNTYKRLTVNFYGLDTATPVASMIISEHDKTAAGVAAVIYDPQEKLTLEDYEFYGWSLNEDCDWFEGKTFEEVRNDAKTIADIRTYILNELDFSTVPGQTLKIYAVLLKYYTVEYLSKDGDVIFKKESFLYKEENPEGFDYTVNLEYPFADSLFAGWQPAIVNVAHIVSPEGVTSESVIANNTAIKITGDVAFLAYITEAHWLRFDGNGKNVSYTPPARVLAGDYPDRPDVPIRTGYDFDGWYTDKSFTEKFIFKEDVAENPELTATELTADTYVYAKWIPWKKASYKVIIWKQKILRDESVSEDNVNAYYVLDDHNENAYEVYDILYYEDAYVYQNNDGETHNTIKTETSPSIVSGSQSSNRLDKLSIKKPAYGGRPEDSFSTIGFDGFRCSYIDDDKEIAPEGDAVLNVYFDRNVYNFHFQTTLLDITLDDLEKPYGTPIGAYMTAKVKAGFSFQAVGDYKYFQNNEDVWYFDTMPDEDVTFDFHFDAGYRLLRYYYATLPGQQADVTYSGKSYTYYADYASKREWWDRSMIKVPAGCSLVYAQRVRSTLLSAKEIKDDLVLVPLYTGIGNGGYIYCLFDRLPSTLRFMDGVYVDGDENGVPSNVSDPFRTESVTFGDSLSAYKNYIPNKPQSMSTGRGDYVFSGWYLDKSCNRRYDFDTGKMPAENLTLYAKWHLKQYRVFLHPNAGASTDLYNNLSWGTEDEKGMCFRVDIGEAISAPTGTRTGYKFDGWYLDDGSPLPDNYELYDRNTVPYDKAAQENLTDVMDRYGNITSTAENSFNNDLDRDWITQKIDIYGKWIPAMVGAEGISIQYVIGEGDNKTVITENFLHKNGTYVVAPGSDEAIRRAPEGQFFAGWILQTYNEETGKFDDKKEVYPGEIYTVIQEDARITDPDDNNSVVTFVDAEDAVDENPNKKFDYLVQLRANYVPEDIKTTYIRWFVNYDNKAAFHTDTLEDQGTRSTLAFNKEVDIQKAPERIGYMFVGWAKVHMGDTAAEASDWYKIQSHYVQTLDEDDVFLYYKEEDDAYFLSYSETDDTFSDGVTKIAADSTSYDAMFAVWKEVPTFTIYHSSNKEAEVCNVPMTRKGAQLTFDITKKVRPGYLYGGYYDSNGEFDKGDPGSDPGTAVEVADEEPVYYLKEVDSNYLKPQLYLVYNLNTRVIEGLYGLINVDSAGAHSDYQVCGLLVRDTKDGSETEILDVTYTTLNGIKVIKEGQQEPLVTLNEENFGDAFKEGGALYGKDCFVGCTQIDQKYVEPGAELEIKAFYLTQDNVRVTGSKYRKIKFTNTNPVTFENWSTTKTGIVKNGTSDITDITGADDNDDDGNGNENGNETQGYGGGRTLNSVDTINIVLPKTYSVNKFYGTEELDPQTVKPGARSGEITYPKKDGYLFTGWFKDEALSTPADFSDVQGDMTVYAGYIPKKDVTLSLARKTGKTGDVTFTATVSIKNTNKFTEVGVSCDHDGEKSEEALTKKTYVNVGSSKSPKYTYKFSGPVEVKSLEATDSFTASVYWVTKDGTRVMSDAKTCTYKGGSVKVQN